MRTVWLALVLTLAACPGIQAQGLRSFCAAAANPVQADGQLAEAVRAEFGAVAFTSTAAECLYPLKVLRYADADVLLTQGNVPGGTCHGCSAHLSAYVLRRAGGGLKPAARFIDFAQAGTFGEAGTITPLTIGGDDGLAIESGGMFQGFSSAGLDLYIFRAGRVVRLAATPAITTSFSNGGAMTDDRQVIEFTGSWSIPAAPGTELALDYRIKTQGHSRVEHAVWTLTGSRLVLTRGHVPAELQQADGGR